MEGGKEKERTRLFSVLELATNRLAWSVSYEDRPAAARAASWLLLNQGGALGRDKSRVNIPRYRGPVSWLGPSW